MYTVVLYHTGKEKSTVKYDRSMTEYDEIVGANSICFSLFLKRIDGRN